MPKTTNPNDIHSAADTWSGFIYQGKVALYHVLKLIVEDYANSIDLFLQLDSLEDFAIVNEDISRIVSLHQVKAMKSRRYSEYNEAFQKLVTRLYEYPSEKGAFFHLANPNEKTNMEIKALHPTIDIYQYNTGNYHCSLNEIDTLIDNYISVFLASNHPERNNLDYRQIVRNCLEDIIVSQIIGIHAINHNPDGLTIEEGAYYLPIPFTSFLQILNNDQIERLSDSSYFLNSTRRIINIYFTDFITDREEEYKSNGNENELTEELKLKLSNYLFQINSLNDIDLVNFIKNLIPNREFKLDNIFDFKDNNIENNGFKRCFLKILFELSKSKTSINNRLLWEKINDGKRFTPTAILSNSNELKYECGKIYKNVVENDFEVPYQTDVLITNGLDAESLKNVLNNQFDLPESYEINKKNNIVKWSEIGLASIYNINKDELL